MDDQDSLKKRIADDPKTMQQDFDPVIRRACLESRGSEIPQNVTLSPLEDREVIHLSPREKDVAILVARGLANKCIAKQLEISPWTVATHLRRMFRKLGVTSRTAMTAKLVAAHLLVEDELLHSEMGSL